MILQYYPGGGTDYIEFPSTTGNIKYYLLDTFKGLSGAPVLQQSLKSPNQNGMTWLGTLFEPRIVEFDIVMTAPSLQEIFEEQRNVLVPAFDISKCTDTVGALVFVDESGNRFLLHCLANNTCPEPMVGPVNRNRFMQKYHISLIAHDPFWYSGSPYTETFAFSSKSFFPVDFPFKFQTILSASKDIVNLGSRQTPVSATFMGPMEDPILTNSKTGKIIGFDEDIAAGDYFELSTDENDLYIYYYKSGIKENGFPYLTAGTTLKEFILMPGTNPLVLSATNNGSGSYVTIEWSDKYSGV